MLAMLIAYDGTGAVVATLDHLVARNEAGDAIGLLDFEAHEAAGGKLRDIWNVEGATGSGTWPEWLDRAHDFRVELDKDKRIVALVHAKSGHRRERAAVLAAIDAAPVENGAKDIRHIVGGPSRPLPLDDQGRTAERRPMGTPTNLPLIGAKQP